MKAIKHIIGLVILAAGLVSLSGCGRTATSTSTTTTAAATDSKSAPDAQKVNYKPYPFDTSIVTAAKLGAKPVVFIQDGYEVKVSDQGEEDTFKKDPVPFLEKIKVAYATAKLYPLDTCLVCDMKLDADAITFVYEGRQFKVCGGDEDCYSVFQKDPAKYVKIWDEEAAKAATTTAK